MTREEVIKLLGKGNSPATVALIAGVPEQDIAELLADPEFANEVSKLRLEKADANYAFDAMLEDVETTLLGNIKKTAPLLLDPVKAGKLLAQVNGIKRRMHSQGESSAVGSTVVSLSLPQGTVARFMVNGTGQVIEVEGRPMATIGAKTLMEELKNREAAKVIEGTAVILGAQNEK